jgi:hypothetical protein
MPDFDEPYQPTSIRQQMTLSLYEPTQFDRIWSMVHWQLENQIKSNRLFKEGILRGLPHQLTKIETEREKNPIIASQLEQENLAYLIDLSIEHIKDQVPPLEMTNLNLAQKQQKGNRSIYLSALLSIAQIEHEVYFASAAQVQKWFEPDLLTLDDYSYPLVRIQNQWYDLQMGKSLPNVLPMSLLGGKAVKIYAFRKEASDLTQAEFMEIEKIVENEYWMDLDFQILKNRKLQIKVQQRFQGEQAVYFDQKIKQDPNHQELRNLLSTDWNRWIGRHDLSQLKVTFEKGILTFNYHIQSKIEAPIRFPLNANQWQRKFASLKDRKHDLYLPKQTQHLRLKIACEDEGEIQKIKQAFEKRMNGNAQSWQHEKVRFLLKAGDLKAGDLKAGWMLEADWELKGGVVRAEDYAGWKNIIKQIDQEEYLDID